MDAEGRIVGRYAVHGELASGGMATLHIGCTLGAVGFARAIVLKRLHREFASSPEFVGMFVDEARLASRIRHPNVIPTLDVVAESGELFLVLEYVHGESLARLIAAAAKKGSAVDLGVVSSIAVGMLEGLHAAHGATNEKGERLDLVHRDVSPQNVLVGVDGVARVFDFGIAKASAQLHETQRGSLRGKMAYMAPEQLGGGPIDRRADVWAAGVVLWEMITCRRLMVGDSPADYLDAILRSEIPPPSTYTACPTELDAAILRALCRDRDERFGSARELADAVAAAVEPAPARAVGEWVERLARTALDQRAALVAEVEGQKKSERALRREIAALEGSSFVQTKTEPLVTASGSHHDASANPPRVHHTRSEDTPGRSAEVSATTPGSPAPSARRGGLVWLGVAVLAALVVGGVAARLSAASAPEAKQTTGEPVGLASVTPPPASTPPPLPRTETAGPTSAPSDSAAPPTVAHPATKPRATRAHAPRPHAAPADSLDLGSRK